jgi:hypothetical protein
VSDPGADFVLGEAFDWSPYADQLGVDRGRTTKALTFTQPWASLVAGGFKRIETRSWGTSYRGPLAIHAAKTVPPWVIDALKGGLMDDLLQWAPSLVPMSRPVAADDAAASWPRGAVVAVAKLVSCVHLVDEHFSWLDGLADPASWARERAFGDFAEGRYAWILDGVIPLNKPIPMRGRLGLWEADVPLVR